MDTYGKTDPALIEHADENMQKLAAAAKQYGAGGVTLAYALKEQGLPAITGDDIAAVSYLGKQLAMQDADVDGMKFSVADDLMPIDDEDSKTLRDNAARYFGTTYNWRTTGYLTTDGKRLDFSGVHNGAPSNGQRNSDHREIVDVYDEAGIGNYSGSEAMIDFMRRGNIRISPESAGINLQKIPTEEQQKMLKQFISRNAGEVIVDIDNEYGDTINTLEFDRGTRADTIILEIVEAIKKGEDYESPYGDDFRYSVADDVTTDDLKALREIGRKSVSDFSQEDLASTKPWAKHFYRELGAKSPFFRAEVGEWRNSDTNLVEIAYTEKETSKSGRVKNKDTGWEISYGERVRGETRGHSWKNSFIQQAIKSIDEIIEKSILLDSAVSEPSSKNKMPATAFMHSLFAVVSKDGRFHAVKLFVEEAISSRNNEVFKRAYELKEIKERPFYKDVHLVSEDMAHDSNSRTFTIAQLYEFVKDAFEGTPKKYIPGEQLNADGTPKENIVAAYENAEGMTRYSIPDEDHSTAVNMQEIADGDAALYRQIVDNDDVKAAAEVLSDLYDSVQTGRGGVRINESAWKEQAKEIAQRIKKETGSDIDAAALSRRLNNLYAYMHKGAAIRIPAEVRNFCFLN